MLVDEEIIGNVYINLVNYILKKCDSISLTKYHDQHEKSTNRKIKIILSTSDYSMDYIMERYSDDFLNKIYNKFKDDEDIFNNEYREKYEDGIKNDFKRWLSISSSIKKFYYNNITNQWLAKNKFNTFNHKKNVHDFGNEKIYLNDTYSFRLNDELRREILSKKSLYDWRFPNSLEDICFFKDGYCFLETITHENLCFIYCDNKEEYEYLKSIGVKFFDKEFKPTKMDKWKYSDGGKQ